MHDLVKQLIEIGAIDSPIKAIEIDDWFQNAIISFTYDDTAKLAHCVFEQCYEIVLKHDKSYNKVKRKDGSNDYSYYIQDVEVSEENGFCYFNISAWPLDGAIVCKSITIVQR